MVKRILSAPLLGFLIPPGAQAQKTKSDSENDASRGPSELS
jgi:hypothetical protein